MKAEETELKDCWVLEPNVFEDERGYFFEGFNSKRFKSSTGFDFEVKQINHSRSTKGVLRGLHFQTQEKAQAKLISCIDGELLDVAVDLRPKSPTYGKYFMIRLSAHNKKQLFIPKGMAHGFLVLSESAKLMYLVDELYSKEHDAGIIYNDPNLNISWGMTESEMILSEKDKHLPLLKDAKIDF
ncbi:dTDP-4-dehydrorhamnose 3,5-epimerase [Ekhidna sp.]|uniref:dTDP-4-dehydrorhamnose 3,5-epimerase n=1 Tax=Ekhidna sp. TaxID=2608089 RepID=UPI003B599BC6